MACRTSRNSRVVGLGLSWDPRSRKSILEFRASDPLRACVSVRGCTRYRLVRLRVLHRGQPKGGGAFSYANNLSRESHPLSMLRQRFTGRSELSGVVTHPRFGEFLIRKAEELRDAQRKLATENRARRDEWRRRGRPCVLERSSCALLSIEPGDASERAIELGAPPVVVGFGHSLIQFNAAKVLLCIDHGDERSLRRDEGRPCRIHLRRCDYSRRVPSDSWPTSGTRARMDPWTRH